MGKKFSNKEILKVASRISIHNEGLKTTMVPLTDSQLLFIYSFINLGINDAETMKKISSLIRGVGDSVNLDALSTFVGHDVSNEVLDEAIAFTVEAMKPAFVSAMS